MDITIAGKIELTKILKTYELSDWGMLGCSIGNDAHITILMIEKMPERIKGMFVSRQGVAHYKALKLSVDWLEGYSQLLELIDFGEIQSNVHEIQALNDGYLLLSGRAGERDKNALITDSYGNVFAKHHFGDGILQCMVDSQNRIITSYFDEGVFSGNDISAAGVVQWNAAGEILWKNTQHDICDCYAINIDAQDNLWFYYYINFNLVKTNYKEETVFNPKINGASHFMFNQSRTHILFDQGYDKHGKYTVKELQHDQLTNGEDAYFVYRGEKIKPHNFVTRDTKVVLMNKDKSVLYFTDWV